MKKIITITLALTYISGILLAGTRQALTVFIGDYPTESGWYELASQNDKTLILNMLHSLNFEQKDIICLENADATYSGIMSALEELVTRAKTGDQIYIHFSCHGQQITDQDGDEALINPKDRYDEAIVPYDACIAYNWNGYKGEHHLIDDVLNSYINRISAKVGKTGCLLVVHDACHSGGLERENNEFELPPHRGTFAAFDQPLTGKKGTPEILPVTWISLSACKDFQTNFEVNAAGQRYGRLSYAISRCLRAGMTVAELVEAIGKEYATLPLPVGYAQTLHYCIPEKMHNKKLFAR